MSIARSYCVLWKMKSVASYISMYMDGGTYISTQNNINSNSKPEKVFYPLRIQFHFRSFITGLSVYFPTHIVSSISSFFFCEKVSNRSHTYIVDCSMMANAMGKSVSLHTYRRYK